MENDFSYRLNNEVTGSRSYRRSGGAACYVLFVISSINLYDLELGSLSIEMASVIVYGSHDLVFVLWSAK